ncbi:MULTISPECIES: 5-formyltetrahydrofolate cyclo-ligase [unclassified Shewanella]|uniref:5-formyltetrahydrofolate cyclo-ligase n=1 Tax=unclassified Shewanella TaxID=196818 RepID=UPI000C7B07C3|nr:MULTISPECIES: 5-formyltetrahydrofolate cyclo-ligase [unclassified Shewanella]PKG57873.1 5-formyltetrahydrofolate cyclo-ligase [Shewanella sp. GutDb-MelDb]PKG76038.1 5-formyltetrahydrofolate cyclo-ligase [Shewanella sp. GutCb]
MPQTPTPKISPQKIARSHAETPAVTSPKAIRQAIRVARRNLSSVQQSIFANTAAIKALQKLKQLKADKVALYLTNDGELDTQVLIKTLWQQGIHVYLPRLHPFTAGNLIFLRYDEDTTVEKNSLGIWEPHLDITQMILPHQLDVVITPLVAFDDQGNRMGMGGGYYDRTLANWQTCGKPFPIGYAHDCQQVTKLACEHWDVPLPFIITPSKNYSFD